MRYDKFLPGLLLTLSVHSATANCTNPAQVLYFTNSLLTRRCDWVSQVDLWRTTNTQYQTIFLGDSLIANGNWGSAANMGIGGDTTQLLLQRIDVVINAKPNDVYILVGINDFWRSASVTQVFNLYNGVVNKLKLAGISVHIISTLQCNPTLKPEICPTARLKVIELNGLLSQIANINFIDADFLLSDTNGLLEQYTTDGIHLNAAGYSIIYGLI